MPLDEKEVVIARDSLLTIGEERLRIADRINDLVRQAIKLREVEFKLELAYDRLAGLISSSLEVTRKEVEKMRNEKQGQS
jgi:hypothetical protein